MGACQPPALAIEAEGGDAGAAPFTRARSALNAETPSVSHVVDFPRSLGDRQDPYAAGRRPHLFPCRPANGHVELGKARGKALARIAAILECLW